jgi:hypothetical protein
MRRPWLPLLAALGVIAGWAVLAYVPAERVPTPKCQLRSWTGLLCPGCGGTRAARHLAKGNVRAAARCNVLMFPIAGAVLWGLVAFAANSWAGKRWWTPERITLRLALWAGVILVLFTITRNLEFASFLRP